MATQPSDLYKLLFETWRSQVDSYWQRSNYFAAFETVAVAGCWHLLDTKHFWTEVGLSILGIALTITWFLNNRKTNSYVHHWWSAIIKLEEQMGLKPNDFATQIEGRSKHFKYRNLVQTVPVLFGIAWIVLFAAGATKVLCYCQK
jgi:hypothetical protein